MEIGDKVIHQLEGACYVTEIVERQIYDYAKEYFVLTPLLNKKMLIYVSKDNINSKRVRPIISFKEWRTAEDHVDCQAYDWVSNARHRNRRFVDVIGKFCFEDVLSIFKDLSIRDQEQSLKAQDRNILMAAQKLICSEVALLLNQDYESVISLKNEQYLIKDEKVSFN